LNDSSVAELIGRSARVAESLVKFQRSKAANALFAVRRMQTDWDDPIVPGREVVSIVKARERFGG
jgi:hypothetical protein